MYILIPLGFFLFSLGGIFFVVYRKFIYLKKLTPEAIGDSELTLGLFIAGMFPEITRYVKNLNLKESANQLTLEFEKALRRLRLIFLKIESFTHKLSIKVKRQPDQVAVKNEVYIAKDKDPKEREQYLIMEIAKNPKDARLYVELGDIYLETGEKDNAKTSFETALQLDPKNWYAKKKAEELEGK